MSARRKRVDTNIRSITVKARWRDAENPPIDVTEYTETRLDDNGNPRKYVFKNRNNKFVNAGELTITRT